MNIKTIIKESVKSICNIPAFRYLHRLHRRRPFHQKFPSAIEIKPLDLRKNIFTNLVTPNDNVFNQMVVLLDAYKMRKPSSNIKSIVNDYYIDIQDTV